MKLPRLFIAGVLLVISASACSKKAGPTSDAHAGHDHSTHAHEHKAPHGGTPIVLGKEAYHLELVLDRAGGKLSAYVLDGEMENYVRLQMPAFQVVATVSGAKQILRFTAQADSATGEKVGDSALFEATADWLKTATTFDAVITSVEIRGTPFFNVAFHFPTGNEKPE